MEIKNKDDFGKQVNKTIDDLFHKTQKADMEVIDLIQEDVKCCGTYGPKFWYTMPNNTIPISCYKDEKRIVINLYKDGCQKAFFDLIIQIANIIGIVVLALAATEVSNKNFRSI